MPDKQRWEATAFLDTFVLDRALSRLLLKAFAGTSITPVDYALYSSIQTGAPRTATAIAQDLHVPLTTMTDWIAAPVRRGHVTRVRSPHDGRAWLLTLTDEGTAALTEGRAAFGRAYEAFLAHSSLGTDELRATLTQMTRAIDRASDDLD
ncbi:MarR family winged helix-turn-helix transcriptional regulator [Propionibacteriaceae bacterium Y1685]|uniref:MarR family winged helix-turn-helix transcriptional regulator n=1 Tax=Microlunatus sp. Y1700 TaxID=3418487 RepID=UPI003B820E39